MEALQVLSMRVISEEDRILMCQKKEKKKKREEEDRFLEVSKYCSLSSFKWNDPILQHSGNLMSLWKYKGLQLYHAS